LAVLALAVALAVKTGVTAARLKSIPIKEHGCKACSLFALGIHSLRNRPSIRIPRPTPVPKIAAQLIEILGCLTQLSEGANKSWCSPTGARPVRVRP
jgi:hypothetical protein